MIRVLKQLTIDAVSPLNNRPKKVGPSHKKFPAQWQLPESLFLTTQAVSAYGSLEKLNKGIRLPNVPWTSPIVCTMQLRELPILSIGSSLKLVRAWTGRPNPGFLFALKHKFKFTVLGTAKTLSNRTVVLKLQWCSGRKAILAVWLALWYKSTKLFVLVWAVPHLGKQWLVRCTTYMGAALTALKWKVCSNSLPPRGVNLRRSEPPPLEVSTHKLLK